MDEAIQSILQQAGAKLLPEAETAAPVAVVPGDFRLECLEELMPKPSRIRQSVRLHRSADFTAYVNCFKNSNSVIFIAPDLVLRDGAAIATALIDYHGRPSSFPNGASWNTHSAALVVEASPQYALLSSLDGKTMDQPEFAERVRDLARYCSSHDTATLLELVNTMNLTSRGNFASAEDHNSGSMRLVYDVQVQANAGTQEKKLEVPHTLEFTMPMLLDGAAVTITADLLFRVPRERGGKVQLGLRLPERRWQELETIEATAKALAEATDLLTMVGTP